MTLENILEKFRDLKEKIDKKREIILEAKEQTRNKVETLENQLPKYYEEAEKNMKGCRIKIQETKNEFWEKENEIEKGISKLNNKYNEETNINELVNEFEDYLLNKGFEKLIKLNWKYDIFGTINKYLKKNSIYINYGTKESIYIKDNNIIHLNWKNIPKNPTTIIRSLFHHINSYSLLLAEKQYVTIPLAILTGLSLTFHPEIQYSTLLPLWGLNIGLYMSGISEFIQNRFNRKKHKLIMKRNCNEHISETIAKDIKYLDQK